jgi:hypothetical protein
MGSLQLFIFLLEGDQDGLRCTGERPRSIELFAEDTAGSLLENIRDLFGFADDVKLLLYYEKMKHDPDDPSEYRLINAQAVVTKAHRYIETGDVTVLMVPLENGALELFCRAQHLQAASVSAGTGSAAAAAAATPAAAAAGLGRLDSSNLLPAVTPNAAAAASGGLTASSGGAGLQMRGGSSSTGSSVKYSAITVLKSQMRRQLLGVSVPADTAPSPVGYGKGKCPEHDWCKYMYKLIPEHMLRTSDGMYILEEDKVPDSQGADRQKQQHH